MEFWSSFWDVIWFLVCAFIFIACLIALFSIITDLFRDSDLKGGWKALWLMALVLVPFITSLVYLIFRGKGMAERAHRSATHDAAAVEDYIRNVASVSPSEEISKAKALLDSGAINADEYGDLKARALGQSNILQN